MIPRRGRRDGGAEVIWGVSPRGHGSRGWLDGDVAEVVNNARGGSVRGKFGVRHTRRPLSHHRRFLKIKCVKLGFYI